MKRLLIALLLIAPISQAKSLKDMTDTAVNEICKSHSNYSSCVGLMKETIALTSKLSAQLLYIGVEPDEIMTVDMHKAMADYKKKQK